MKPTSFFDFSSQGILMVLVWFLSGIVNLFLSIPFLRSSAIDTDKFDMLTLHDQRKVKKSVFTANFFCVFCLILWIFNFILFLALFITGDIKLFPSFCAAYSLLSIFSWSIAVAESVKARYFINLCHAGKKSLSECQASWSSISGDGLSKLTGIVLGQKNSARIGTPETDGSKKFFTRKTASLVCFSDGRNSIITGPARSGKTSGIAIPTAMLWQGNLIVHDVLGNCYRATKSAREKMSDVYYIAPDAPSSACYNPLADIPDGDLIEKFGISLAAPFFNFKDEESFFGCVPARLFAATAIHISLSGKYKSKNKNLAFAAKLLEKESDTLWDSLIKEMINTRHINSHGEHFDAADDFIRLCVEELLSLSNESMQNSVEFLHFATRPLFDSTLSKLLSASDFSAKDFFNPEKRVTVYLSHENAGCCKGGDIQVIFTEILYSLITLIESTNCAMDTRCLAMLDDFTSLKRIPHFARLLNNLQYKRMSFLILAQSIAQIDNIYGESERKRIIDECDITAFFTPADFSSAKQILDIVETRTVKKLKNAFGTSDIMTIPSDSILLARKNSKHYLAKKILWHDDPRFRTEITETEND